MKDEENERLNGGRKRLLLAKKMCVHLYLVIKQYFFCFPSFGIIQHCEESQTRSLYL